MASTDDAVVSVDAGRPPELVRTWFRSAMAPALSPVPRRASARRRINSSFRMIGIGDDCVGQMLKPSVDEPLVGPSPVTGPCRDGRPVRILVVYRSSGCPFALSWASAWNDMCAYKVVFVACVNVFGVSGDAAYVSYTPTSNAVRVAAVALRNDSPSAV